MNTHTISNNQCLQTKHNRWKNNNSKCHSTAPKTLTSMLCSAAIFLARSAITTGVLEFDGAPKNILFKFTDISSNTFDNNLYFSEE